MSFEGYQEALQSHREKEDRLSIIENQMKTLLTALGNIKDQNQVNQMAKTLYDSKILNIALAANKENEKQQ